MMHTKQRKIPWALLMGLVIGLGIRLWIAWLPTEVLARGIFGDDSFYFLNIARNIASGYGPTHDRIHPTNGYQPLYTFLLVPLFWLMDDKRLIVNLVATLLALLSTATALPLYGIGKQLGGARMGVWAAFFWLFSPSALRQSLNGMETGVYTLFLSLSLWFYLRWVQAEPRVGLRRALGWAVLLSVTLLTRIDGVFFLACVVGDYLLRHRSVRSARLTAAAVLFFSFLPLLSWLGYNQRVCGSALPCSGRAVRFLSFAYLGKERPTLFGIHMGYGLREGVVTLLRVRALRSLDARIKGKFGRAGAFGFWLMLILGGGVFLWWAFFKDKDSREELKATLRRLAPLHWFLVYCLLLFLAYSLYGLGFWFFPRYFFPMTIAGVLYGAAFVEAVSSRLARRQHPRHPLLPTPHLPPCGVFAGGWQVVVVVAQLFMLIAGWQYFATLQARFEDYYGWAVWINKNLPKDARVGVFQSGTVGYFANLTVIGLDGVVNEQALKAMQEGRMLSYVTGERIRYVADWEDFIWGLLWKRSSPAERRLWKLKRIRRGSPAVYEIVPATGGS